MKLVILYVPCPDKDTAENLVKTLIENKLVACGNIHKSDSLYIWQGEMVKEEEWIAVMKTLNHMTIKAESKIMESHPYDIPAVIHWSAKCNEPYFKWMQQILDS